MSIKLHKKTGINLKKGASISLEKEGRPLRKICIGLNWGVIRRKGILGRFIGKSVDLDGSVCMFDTEKEHAETVYYRNLRSRDRAIRHSGDDLTGDLFGDDGRDNEVIQVDLVRLRVNIEQLFFVLNSFKKQDFATIPYAKIRIYEGTPKRVAQVLATFNVAADPKYAGYVSMVMGKLHRNANNIWSFTTLGDPMPEQTLGEVIHGLDARYA